MLTVILVTVVSFAGGYVARKWVSHRRRAAAREAFFERKRQKQIETGAA
jgi:predicted transporter